MRSAIADPYHYILNGDGVEELFNYRTDPLEERNLASSPVERARLASFRALLRPQGVR
jgi:hypothetical protein